MIFQLFFVLGIFGLGSASPLDPIIPKVPGYEEVQFFLWTKNNPDVPQNLILDDRASVDASNFIHGGPIKLLTHGFMSSCFTATFVEMKDHVDAYLTMGDDVNVICVDWKPYAYHWSGPIFYPDAAANTEPVGMITAKFIDFLLRENYVLEENIYFQGHSLGGHVAGFAGQYMTEGRLHNILALDPAGPGFDGTDIPANKRLDPTDAEFVQVMHTDGRDGIFAYGTLRPMGHVDMYPAGGHSQPYCQFINAFGCSHFIAAYYANDAIEDGPAPPQGVSGFWACPCPTAADDVITEECKTCAPEDKVLMGPWINRSAAHGQYYMAVNRRFPYGQG